VADCQKGGEDWKWVVLIFFLALGRFQSPPTPYLKGWGTVWAEGCTCCPGRSAQTKSHRSGAYVTFELQGVRIRPYGHPHEPLARWLVPGFGIPSHSYCTATVLYIPLIHLRPSCTAPSLPAFAAGRGAASCKSTRIARYPRQGDHAVQKRRPN
jgi:hypothetical protein